MFPISRFASTGSSARRRALPALIALTILAVACGRQFTDDERLERAQGFKSSGDYRAAVVELKQVLQNDDRNVRAARLLGEIYVRIGDGPSAEKELRRARDHGADDVDTLILIGEALLLQGKYQQVLRETDSAIDASLPTAAETRLLILRGDARFGLREMEQAHAHYTAVLALDEDSLAARLGLARIGLAESRYDQAEAQLAEAARIAPESIEMWIIRGNLRQAQSRYDEAERAFSGALERIQSRGMTEQRFRAMLGLATSQIMQQKYGEAEKGLRTLKAEAPDHFRLGYLGAWLAYLQGDYETARTDLLQVERQAPGNMQVVLLLGATYYALGNNEQANAYLTRFVNAVPTHVLGRKLLGATRLRLDRADEAMNVLTPALDGAQEQDTQLLLMIGRAAAQAGDSERELDALKRAARIDPGDQTIRAELARVYLRQGAIDDAIGELEAAAGEGEADRQAQLLLVTAHLGKGDFEGARDVVDRLIHQAPEDPGLQVLRGEIAMMTGMRNEARSYYNAALGMNADHAPARLGLGRMDLEDGHLAESGRHFDRVLQINARSVPAMIGMAQLAERQGEKEQALSWLEKARAADARALVPRLVLTNHYLQAQEFTRALSVAQEMAREYPEEPGALHPLARAQVGAGDLHGAAGTYGRLAQLRPQAATYLELAAVQSRINEHAAARGSFRRALELDPGLLSAKIGLALLERTIGQQDEAMRLAQQIQKEHPDAAVGYSLAGELYRERGDLSNAQASFRRAVDRDPSPLLISRLAQVYLSGGQESQAIETLEQGVARHPDVTALRTMLGTAYQQAGRAEAARAEYDRVLRQEPANVVALNNNALIYLGRGENETALRLAREASRHAPASPQVLDTLGWVKVQSGRVQEGLEILDGLASHEDPAIHYHLAAALALAGRETEARTRLETLLRTSDSFREREEARLLLERLSRPTPP